MARQFDLNVCRLWLRHGVGTALIVLTMVGLTACGMFGTQAEAPTPPPTRTPLPTFTPTAEIVVAQATVAPLMLERAPEVVVAENDPVGASPATVEAPPPPAEEATPAPRLTISSDLVNIRSGPTTDFDLLATVSQGETYALTSKNAAGDWWQICCIDGQPGWVYFELATVENADAVAVVDDLPAESVIAPVVQAPTDAALVPPPEAEAPTEVPVAAALPTSDPFASSAGDFNPDAQYQIVNFRVLGLDENNGGIRDSSAQHHIFLTVLDSGGNGVDGAVVKNLVGEQGEVVTGAKGPGKAEITMYYEPFKLAVASDPSGPVTSQVSNQMGLVFPHLPDLVGKLGDENYEYGACPTIDIKCEWPIQAIHFSYEITFQKVR